MTKSRSSRGRAWIPEEESDGSDDGSANMYVSTFHLPADLHAVFDDYILKINNSSPPCINSGAQ